MNKLNLPYPVIVAGHICLDIIPHISDPQFNWQPGSLVKVGEAQMSTGGAVPNTGIALHRLGVPTKLMGKIGNDSFGEIIQTIISTEDHLLSDAIIRSDDSTTSYSVVINPPNVDRMFLHCTGANDTFVADDLADEALQDAGLLHLGYPPLMKKLYQHNGAELKQLMKRAKQAHLTTSLDMARPDPQSESGQLDWRAYLQNVLPYVDLFHPSIEELLYMLNRDLYDELSAKYEHEQWITNVPLSEIERLADELLDMGTAFVTIKLGHHGLYMKTTSNISRLQAFGRYTPRHDVIQNWLDCTLYTPCYSVDVVGTTGAGDCTIAGFITGFISGLSPELTILTAVGTGALNVESKAATSSIVHLDLLQKRQQSGWLQRLPKTDLRHFSPLHTTYGIVYKAT